MTELLALPAVVAVAVVPGIIDIPPTVPAAAPVDPFAAFMANAQSVSAPQLPVAPVSEDDVQVRDEAIPDTASNDPDATIDPTLSPALTLLASLAMPRTNAPNVAAPKAALPVVGRSRPPVQTVTDRVADRRSTNENSPPPAAVASVRGTPQLPLSTETLAEVAKPNDATAPEPAATALIASAEALRAPSKPRLPAVAASNGVTMPVAEPSRRAVRVEPASPALRQPVTNETLPIDVPIMQIATVTGDAGLAEAAAPLPSPVDQLVQGQLVIADDSRWLDSLARDIAHSAIGDALHFKLEPVNLGSLTVAISQGSDGAAIRLTAETHRARDLLIDAQPSLVAEARANGLRISETHVDLNDGSRERNANGNPSPPNNQPSFASNPNDQQATRQDVRRQADLPPQLPNQPRSTAARAPARDDGERFA